MKKIKQIFIKTFVWCLELITSIPKDKLYHFFVGYVHLTLLSLFFSDFEAIAATVLAAAFKEVVWDDIMERGSPNRIDFVWGILPCAFYLIIKLI